MADLFRRIYGSELEGKNSDKSELISHIVEREQLELAGVVMIGEAQHSLAVLSGH